MSTLLLHRAFLFLEHPASLGVSAWMKDEEFRKLKLDYPDDPQFNVLMEILNQLQELNRTLLKLAENVTSCTYVYRGEPVVRTDPIR